MVLLLRAYLESTRFTVRTDHEALKMLLAVTDNSGKFTRWKLHSSELYFDIVHRLGINQQAADVLSRLNKIKNDASPLDDDLPVFTSAGQFDKEIKVSRTEDDLSSNYKGFNERSALFIPEVVKRSRRQAADLEKVPSIAEFRYAQKDDKECCQAADAAGMPNSKCIIDEHGVFVRISQLDDAVQQKVARSVLSRFFYLSYYCTQSRHLGERKIYDTMRHGFRWPHASDGLYGTVKDCFSSDKDRQTKIRVRKLSLFPPNEPLDFVSINIHGLLPKTRGWNQFVIVITVRFTKLSKVVPISKTTAAIVAKVNFDDRLSNYGNLGRALTVNGPNFPSNFFNKGTRSLV